MNNAPDITVMLATYNRSGILRETLERFTHLDPGDLRVEFVVIDNNSDDDTRAAAESFANRLPLRVLFCGTPGKNAALNLGLREANLGSIIIMTDDDVSPRENWLLAIHAACERWPDAAVFGGAVQVVWPDVEVPGWAKHEFIRSFGFAHHEYADRDTPYADGQFPHGPNYWIRREVIEAGHRFDERIGPRPENRILGDETVFLKQLKDAGYKLMYVPDAVVGHRIQPEVLSARGIIRRAATLGRGLPYLHGLPRPELLRRAPWVWRLRRRCSIGRSLLRYLLASLHPSRDARVIQKVESLCAMSSDREALRIERERRGAAGAGGARAVVRGSGGIAS